MHERKKADYLEVLEDLVLLSDQKVRMELCASMLHEAGYRYAVDFEVISVPTVFFH